MDERMSPADRDILDRAASLAGVFRTIVIENEFQLPVGRGMWEAMIDLAFDAILERGGISENVDMGALRAAAIECARFRDGTVLLV